MLDGLPAVTSETPCDTGPLGARRGKENSITLSLAQRDVTGSPAIDGLRLTPLKRRRAKK